VHLAPPAFNKKAITTPRNGPILILIGMIDPPEKASGRSGLSLNNPAFLVCVKFLTHTKKTTAPTPSLCPSFFA
jgi:hypothetical protein